MPKGRRKQAVNASRRHRAKKKGTTTGWNNKKDKSLRGTTTGTCDTSEKNETSIETNSRQRMIDLQGWQRGKNRIQYVPGHHKKKTSDDERKKRKKNRKSNKNNHTTSTTTRTTAASKQRSTDGTVWDTF